MSEGALAAELGNLIHSHLPDKLHLRYEYMYSSLLPTGVGSEDVTALARADLAVYESLKSPSGQQTSSVRFVIELKRASAAEGRINKDLRRLALIVENRENVRAFLCVASEESRPNRFATVNGIARRKEVPVEGSTCVCAVVNLKKAAFLFENRERAHYVCLIEVYLPTED